MAGRSADQEVIGALAVEVAVSCLVTVVPSPLVCVPGEATVTVSVSSLAPVASWASTLYVSAGALAVARSPTGGTFALAAGLAAPAWPAAVCWAEAR